MDDRGIAGAGASLAIIFEDGSVVYPANGLDSRLQDDYRYRLVQVRQKSVVKSKPVPVLHNTMLSHVFLFHWREEEGRGKGGGGGEVMGGGDIHTQPYSTMQFCVLQEIDLSCLKNIVKLQVEGHKQRTSQMHFLMSS